MVKLGCEVGTDDGNCVGDLVGDGVGLLVLTLPAGRGEDVG
jgi:hypothetical protein